MTNREDLKGVPTFIGIVVAVIVALLVALGVHENIFNFLFDQPWSKTLWTNIIFIAVIAGAIALAMKSK